MVDFAAFCICLGLAISGVILGELGRLTYHWSRWLPASFGWAMVFAAVIVFGNASILAATGGSAAVAYSRSDVFVACCGWLLYAAAWPLAVNAAGIVMRKRSVE